MMPPWPAWMAGEKDSAKGLCREVAEKFKDTRRDGEAEQASKTRAGPLPGAGARNAQHPPNLQ